MVSVCGITLILMVRSDSTFPAVATIITTTQQRTPKTQRKPLPREAQKQPLTAAEVVVQLAPKMQPKQQQLNALKQPLMAEIVSATVQLLSDPL